MISSEVQRTLVKSPPELWAELSDPKSLARHLGELGEIRITRAEPEKLVEWKAEEARGSVAIKASGWGTKVTLKATREYTPPDLTKPPEEPESSEVETPEAKIPEAETAEPETETEAAEVPASEAETVTPEAEVETPEVHEAPQEAAEADPPRAPEPTPSGLDAWSRQEAEVFATASERFAHEHPATLLGSDLQLAGDRGLESTESEAEPEPNTSVAEETPAEPAPQAPQPRPGFFARLFGRGRRKRPVLEALPHAHHPQRGDAPRGRDRSGRGTEPRGRARIN